MKRCPYCAEEVQEEAVVCKHCNREIKSQDQQRGNKNIDTKTALKVIGIIALVLLSIAFWYITVPAAILWYLWKSKRISKKNKRIMAAATVVIFLILGSVNAYSGRQPTITITEPEGSKSVQADLITVKGVVSPKKSTVTVQGNKVAVGGKGEFSYEARLNSESNSIAIEAKNGNKTVKTSVTVARIFTEEEKAEREERAETRRKQQEEEAAKKAEQSEEEQKEAKYRDSVAKISESVSKATTEIGNIMTNKPNPLLWTDTDIVRVAGYSVVLESAYDAALELEVPKQFQLVHTLFLEGLKLFAQAMPYMRDGIDNFDAAKMEKAAELMTQGSTKIIEASQKIPN